MEVTFSDTDEQDRMNDVLQGPSLDGVMDKTDDKHITSCSSVDVLEDALQVIEAAFVCKTVQTKVISDQEVDLHVRLTVQKSDTSPIIVNLLKTGIFTCKKSDGKICGKPWNCNGCKKNVPHHDGEIVMMFDVTASSDCSECVALVECSPSKEDKCGGDKTTEKTNSIMEDSDKCSFQYESKVKTRQKSRRRRRPPVRLRDNQQTRSNGVREGGDNEHIEGVVEEDKVLPRKKTAKTSSVRRESCALVQRAHVKTSMKSVKKDSTKIVVGSLFKTVTCKTKKSLRSVRSKFECNQCGVCYSYRAGIEKHVKSHGKTNKRKRTDSNIEVKSKSQLQNEMLTRKSNSSGTKDESESKIRDQNSNEDNLKPENAENDDEVEGINEDTNLPSASEVTSARQARSRSISSVRPHKCSVCGRSYQLLKTLKSHERSHSEVFDYQCDICQKGFHLPSRLKYHMRAHTGERPYQCTVCGSSFVKNGHLTHHMKTHSDDRPHKCPVCGKGFTEACYLKVHERNHTGEKPYQCDQCGKCFTNSSSFHFHQRIHNTETFKCDMCDKTFQTEKTLQQHQAVHSGVRPFICDHCGKGCLTLSRLNRHKRTHSADRPHKCSVCNKGFHDPSDLRVHTRIHSGVKPFKCDRCDKKFSLKESLNRHALVHSESRPHKCDKCVKSFASVRQLKKHAVIHTGTKEFICEQCGKSFLTSSSLRSHNQTHAGYRPHKCDICGRTYRSSWYLQVHRKTHTGENLLQCHTCGDWFINPSYFKLHQEKHCKGKLLYCTVCSRGFSNNNALQSHMGLHTGERPYGCNICGKAFVKSALLQDHIKRHSEENVHKCRVCGKGFKRTNDLKKHELRHERKMRKLNLPDRLKPGHKERDLLQQATDSIRDVAGDMMEVNLHIVPEMETPQVLHEQVVLATIDSSQISDQTLMMEEPGKAVLPERVVMSADHHYFSEHTSQVVQSHMIPSSSGIHMHGLTSDPHMFHTNSQTAVPVVSSHQIVSHSMEPGQLQTLTPLQPTTVPLPGQTSLQPPNEQQLTLPMSQNTSLSHPMSSHNWMY